MQLLARSNACSEEVGAAIEEARCGRNAPCSCRRCESVSQRPRPVAPRSCLSDAFETQQALSYHSDCYVSVAKCKATGGQVVLKTYLLHQLSPKAREQVRMGPGQASGDSHGRNAGPQFSGRSRWRCRSSRKWRSTRRFHTTRISSLSSR
jgi:hypothetical protein